MDQGEDIAIPSTEQRFDDRVHVEALQVGVVLAGAHEHDGHLGAVDHAEGGAHLRSGRNFQEPSVVTFSAVLKPHDRSIE